jgi:hypothetical protein
VFSLEEFDVKPDCVLDLITLGQDNSDVSSDTSSIDSLAEDDDLSS